MTLVENETDLRNLRADHRLWGQVIREARIKLE